VVGSAKDIADQLEQWFVERACDGFVVAATHLPGAFEDFVRLVSPNCNAAACITASTSVIRRGRLTPVEG